MTVGNNSITSYPNVLTSQHQEAHKMEASLFKQLDVEQRLRLYEALSNQQPRRFGWKFTRAKLAEFLKRLEAHGVMTDQWQAVPELPDTNQGEPLAA